MGEQTNPGDSTDFLIPTFEGVSAFPEGGIFDYFGIPTQVGGLKTSVSTLPFRMYNRVYNEWFRDQNLQDSIYAPTDDGPDSSGISYSLRRRGKRHDYFTSALPWPQKGDSIDLPLGTTAPIIPEGQGLPQFHNAAAENQAYLSVGSDGGLNSSIGSSAGLGAMYWENSGLLADLSQATSATINQLRQAFQIQKLLERDARGGTRYVEIIKSHFGVTTPSAGWRSEYLGGGTRMVNISPVAQTSATDAAVSPQGNLAALGTVTLDGIGFTKSFTEHSTLIGLVNVRADLTYQQGLNRMWSRQTRYYFYWPSLANIGEQAVLNQEIYAQGTADDQLAWGYQERYGEYRYKPSIVTGKFRSNATGTLDAWHLAQDFTGLPPLNAAFIEDNPPVDRVVAVPTEPEFIFDGYFNMRCVRPMPLYGVPGMIDHF